MLAVVYLKTQAWNSIICWEKPDQITDSDLPKSLISHAGSGRSCGYRMRNVLNQRFEFLFNHHSCDWTRQVFWYLTKKETESLFTSANLVIGLQLGQKKNMYHSFFLHHLHCNKPRIKDVLEVHTALHSTMTIAQSWYSTNPVMSVVNVKVIQIFTGILQTIGTNLWDWEDFRGIHGQSYAGADILIALRVHIVELCVYLFEVLMFLWTCADNFMK